MQEDNADGIAVVLGLRAAGSSADDDFRSDETHRAFRPDVGMTLKKKIAMLWCQCARQSTIRPRPWADGGNQGFAVQKEAP